MEGKSVTNPICSVVSFIRRRLVEFRQHSNPLNRFTLVCGNEACDLDSIITPLAFSFIRQEMGERPLIPCINTFTPQILNMRGEVKSVLRGIGLDREDLLFMQNISMPKDVSSLTTMLIDHNEISRQWSRKMHWNDQQINVIGILDHHADAGHYHHVQLCEIETCGSCASLLVCHTLSRGNPDELARLKELAMPLLQTIVFDTVNFTWRQTETDLRAAEYLAEIVGQKVFSPHKEISTDKKVAIDKETLSRTVMTKQIFQQLEQAVEDTPEAQFGIYDLLYKDFKFYEHFLPEKTSKKACMYGISTLHRPFSAMIGTIDDEHLNQWTTEIQRFMADNELDILLITIAVREKNVPGHYQQLAIFTKNAVQTMNLYEFLQAQDARLYKLVAPTNGSYILAGQENITISRKQLHPFMKEFLRQQS